MTNSHLLSPDACTRGQCVAAKATVENAFDCAFDCDHTVKENPDTGRWFITMGHAGFNSPTNNGRGYESCRSAWANHRKYRGASKVGR